MMGNKTKIYFSLLLACVLYISLKIILPQSDVTEMKENSFWLKKTLDNSTYNVVVGGDSRIYRGINPSRIEENFKENITAINLGYSSAGYSAQYLNFLESRLDPNSKYKIMLLGVTPHSLVEKAAENEHLNECINKGKFEYHKSVFFEEFLLFFTTYSPARLTQIEDVENNLEAETDGVQETYLSNGWVKCHKTKIDSSEAINSYIKTFKTNKFDSLVFEDMLNALQRIKENGVHIYWFRPPCAFEMKMLENEQSGFNEEYVKTELTKLGVLWLNFEDTTFVSYDGSHLQDYSADQLSKMVGVELNKQEN
tara:strand:+ start:2485 stop:3414 length:930 start_codon:yes stop_codon:yes gene_type:complete